MIFGSHLKQMAPFLPLVGFFLPVSEKRFTEFLFFDMIISVKRSQV